MSTAKPAPCTGDNSLGLIKNNFIQYQKIFFIQHGLQAIQACTMSEKIQSAYVNRVANEYWMKYEGGAKP